MLEIRFQLSHPHLCPRDLLVELLDLQLHLLEVDLLLVVLLCEQLLARMRPLSVLFELPDSLEDRLFLGLVLEGLVAQLDLDLLDLLQLLKVLVLKDLSVAC